MTAEPFFSERLLVTAPDGTYEGIRSRRTVSAFEDRLEVGDLKIDYAYLDDLRVYGNVLHVVYMASDGKKVEQFFRHDTFLAKTGAQALADLKERVSTARASRQKTSVWTPAGSRVEAQQGVRAELLEPSANGWQRVAVYSALVAFPAICPVCQKAADAVGRLPLTETLRENGWLLPICKDHHAEFAAHLMAQNWRANQSRLEFAIWNRNYAREFLAVNEGTDPDHIRRQAEASPLLYDIRRGKRFVVYQYTVSAIAVSFLRPSEIQVLEPSESVFRRGLKYSALSLAAGWWAIPGPIFTIASVVRNCKGGIDLTPAVAAVISGAAASGGGY